VFDLIPHFLWESRDSITPIVKIGNKRHESAAVTDLPGVVLSYISVKCSGWDDCFVEFLTGQVLKHQVETAQPFLKLLW
jgi:hypothetical protein